MKICDFFHCLFACDTPTLVDSHRTCYRFPSLLKPFVQQASIVQPYFFLFKRKRKKFTDPRLVIKMPFTLSFALVFHATSFAIASTERKQACSPLFEEDGRTILIIDSLDNCALCRCDNRYSS